MIGKLLTRALVALQDRYRRPDAESNYGELPRTYVIEDYVDGEPYLTRTVFPRVLGVRPLLHRFHRPDGDRHLHNHPWEWCLSVVLTGSYAEVRLDRGCDGEQDRVVRRFNFIRHGDYHRITELRGEVFTLFLTGKRVSDWGFLTEDGYVPHEDYKERLRAERERRRQG